MDCVRCNREIPEDAAFCQFCGVDQRGPASTDAPTKRYLRRSQVERQVGGVCGGIAGYFDTDPVFVRVAWVILTIIPGAIFLGVLAYLGPGSSFLRHSPVRKHRWQRGRVGPGVRNGSTDR